MRNIQSTKCYSSASKSSFNTTEAIRMCSALYANGRLLEKMNVIDVASNDFYSGISSVINSTKDE